MVTSLISASWAFLPPLTGALFGIDLGFGLLSVDWISLPTGQSLLGFLGVCLVLAILFGYGFCSL